MKYSWRWFGESDPISLEHIKQAGATDIVSALHYIENGKIWDIDKIESHRKKIENKGLKWTVVESLPVHESIKLRNDNYKELINNYKLSLENLAQCGIEIVCYNFMPVLDWTRTNLNKKLKSGAFALEFVYLEIAMFDLYILKRENASDSYSSEIIQKAKDLFKILSNDEIELITKNILMGLPGSEQGFTIEDFNKMLKFYDGINENLLRSNLNLFLDEIIPHAEKLNIKMCIHPDDPPFSILGLPRVVSNISDLRKIFNNQKSISNGLTFCTGSFGVIPENNLHEIFDEFSNRIHFIHLRNTIRNKDGDFYEAEHLIGDTDMVKVIFQIIKEENKRKKNQRSDFSIPMRPDHGHQMIDDINKVVNPGYSCIGRLKGMAELRGVETALKSKFR